MYSCIHSFLSCSKKLVFKIEYSRVKVKLFNILYTYEENKPLKTVALLSFFKFNLQDTSSIIQAPSATTFNQTLDFFSKFQETVFMRNLLPPFHSDFN